MVAYGVAKPSQADAVFAGDLFKRMAEHHAQSVGGRDPRTAAVHEAAARTALWSGLVSDKVASDLGPAANRLPSFQLTAGPSTTGTGASVADAAVR